jgi:hypothetical protein
MWGVLLALAQGTDPSLGQPWPMYVDDRPDFPDSVITVSDTLGRSDGRLMFGDQQFHYGFQIALRSPDRFGYRKLSAIGKALDSCVNVSVTLETVKYIVQAVSRGDVISLGYEKMKNKRRLYTMNGVFPINPGPGAGS